MAKRQREWAKRARILLIMVLGGTCKECGTKDELEFDCINPVGDWHHQGTDSSGRMSFYRAQHRADNVQLLCKKLCHPKKTRQDALKAVERELTEPF